MRARALSATVLLLAAATSVLAQPKAAAPASAPAATSSSAPTAASVSPSAAATASAPTAEPSTRGDGMAAYHATLEQRRLGATQALRLSDVADRLAEGEDLLRTGRVDESISRLTEMVESPQFQPFAENEEGRAAIFALGDALATAGIYESARGYLRRCITAKGAWDGVAAYARRAVRRLVEIAIESDKLKEGLSDVLAVPASAPEETRGEVSYLTGRAKEADHDPDAALAAYAQVTQRSRFWAQATYLQGLLQVEKGKYKEGEDLFCKVADPKRTAATTPVFADERFFAVRDLARLALGRVAHEQFRFDDSRYYYYLVPRDSDRLAEALYEAATSRYEKKDYEGARELLDDLKALQIHHPYEDEAWILDAYVDLAQCKFPEADQKLLKFLALYEPVRDTARKVQADDRAMGALLAAARSGSDAGNADIGASASPEASRAIAALVRIDPTYGAIARRRAVLDHEASGLTLAQKTVGDMQQALATNGGVRPSIDDKPKPEELAADARAAIDGVRHALDDLDAAHAPAAQTDPLRQELAALEAQVKAASSSGSATNADAAASGKDLPDLLRNDASGTVSLAQAVDAARADLDRAETMLAKDALRRVDLRLSRLLRRARLGRIESVLGRKRALEVEIEAINNGILPASALDSLDAARFLKDGEEYWPFEGDDWPDEFVGGEGLK